MSRVKVSEYFKSYRNFSRPHNTKGNLRMALNLKPTKRSQASIGISCQGIKGKLLGGRRAQRAGEGKGLGFRVCRMMV